MTSPRARAGLVLSVLVLVALALAWLVWPTDDGRADLKAVAPVATSTSTSSSSTAPSTTSVPAAAPATTTTTAPVGAAPTRLRIPAISVDATVVDVGLAGDGQMEIPPAADVGWYRLGPQPGGLGSAVLAAHVDYGGARGAFFDLSAIPVGAEVLVDGATGTQRFVVTTREQVAKAEVQLDRYFTLDGPPRLTLITCGGAFSRSVGHYEDNLIITAVPAP